MHTYRTKQALHFTPGRSATPRLIVVHSTEGDTAAGAAGWFQNPASGGSAHLVVDDHEVYRCVNDADTAWGAIGHNSFGLHLEVAGYARWTEDEWMAHEPRIREAARLAAGWFKTYGIPLQSSGDHGYHSHLGLPGNDHTDPGTGFPWQVWLNHVSYYLGLPEDVRSLPYGRSLRIIRDPGTDKAVKWGGWIESEVPPGFKGTALGPLVALAKRDSPPKRPFLLTWRGSKWDDPADIPKVARSIARRYLTAKEMK
jgi:hypothetical protein